MGSFRGAFCGTLVALAFAKTLKAIAYVVGAAISADAEWDAFSKAVRGIGGNARPFCYVCKDFHALNEDHPTATVHTRD